MEPYTIEDIELLRKRSGLSYQEAVALLDYHSGSLARALIDLEKHGRLREEFIDEKEGRKTMSENNKKNETREKTLNLLQKLYRTRVKIRKGETSIFNVSVIFAGLCLLFAPHMTIAGIIVSLILGYQFSFTSMDPDFASENLEKMVKNAAQNARSSVSSVVQTIQHETKEKQRKESADIAANRPIQNEAAPYGNGKTNQEDPAESIRKQAKEIEETMDSFFDSSSSINNRNSAYSAAASSVPTIQVPVQAETRDGDITQTNEPDGFSSVTVG